MIKLVAGVDLGGTNTVYALVDENGKIYGTGSFPTQKYKDFNDFIAALRDGITSLSRSLDIEHSIEAIGIGAPNGNFYHGTIEYAPNLPWNDNLPLAELLSKGMRGTPVVVTNDANAAAMGEMLFGGAKGMKDFAVITLGTGLGSGIVVGGKVMYGSDGMAGELGHTTYDPNGRYCNCGRRGCVETYVSATGIKRTALVLLGERHDPSLLRKFTAEELTAKDISVAAEAGDKIALECFEYTGKVLGRAIANMVGITAPEAVFLFGGLANAGDLIMKPTRASFEESVLRIWKGKVKIEFSSVEESSAALLGAAALGWDSLMNVVR